MLAPHSAWLLAQGVETLPFRMQAHVDNARLVAEWLEADKRIEFVNWAGLASHPHHERAKHYLPKGPGSVFSFGVKGSATADSRQVGRTFIESVDLASHLANIGDAKTLVIHPGSTTHAQLSEQQLVDAGVLPGLVRISVGIEDPEDIISDLDQALAAAVEGRIGTWLPRLRFSTHRPRHRHPLERADLRHPVELSAGEAAEVAAHLGRAEREGAPRRSCGTPRSVAIVGASPNPARSSYFVATYLQQSSDYDLYFVNPNADEILGQKVYKSLADLPVVPDIVDVFRKGSDIPSVIDDVRRHRREDGLGAARHLEPGRGDLRGVEGPDGRHGPLHQGRARPLPRRPAPARLRHRADHVAQDDPLTG